MTAPTKALALGSPSRSSAAPAGAATPPGPISRSRRSRPSHCRNRTTPSADPARRAGAEPGVQGSYVLERINESEPGQLVTIANPDGLVIGLYRFEATAMSMDALQTFALSLSYTDDKAQFSLDDAGEFKQAGPISQEGALPLTFYSDTYGDQFTGVVLQDIVAIKYDFDGDGQLDTSFGFRRVN